MKIGIREKDIGMFKAINVLYYDSLAQLGEHLPLSRKSGVQISNESPVENLFLYTS